MSRNSLTKPSNCSRTQHEHRSPSFDPRGARAEDGQGVGCWERWRVGTSCCAGKKRVACAFSNPAEQKKSHWTVPAPALLSPLMQPSVKAPQQSSPSPGTESRILLAPAGSQGELHELAMTRNRWFESISLQRRVCKLSVPERRTHRACTEPGCTGALS